jgi:polyphosphate glucokinase
MLTFAKKLQEDLGKDAQVVNDADMQGLGVVSGKGLEMVITLGTGFGTALLMDGTCCRTWKYRTTRYQRAAIMMSTLAIKRLMKRRKKWNKRMEKVFKY